MAGIDMSLDMWKHINDADAMRQAQYAQLANANAQQTSQFPQPKGSLTPMPETLAQRAREMFLKRMGGIRTEMKVAPSDFLACHVYGEVVHVFYCFSGKPGVAQEAIDLFPSDQFITQFRMILT